LASVISMPRLSDTMSDGVLVKWHKKEGDKVEPGQVLGDVETDKAVQECEAFESGTILKILAAEGARIPVGEPIAILGEAGEDVSAILAKLASGESASHASHAAPAPAAAPAAAPAPAPAPKPAPAPVAAAPAPVVVPVAAPVSAPLSSGRILASPVARKIAREADLDLAQVQGSGPSGRIVRKDVEAALAAPKPAPVVVAVPAAAPAPLHIPSAWASNGESKPASSMRRTIARRLVESKTTIPHFYLTMEVDMDEAVKFRALVHDPDAGQPITYNDLIVKAAAIALKRIPEAHAAWEGETIRYFERVDISVAVSTDEGLITPVVRGADQKSIGTIAAEIRKLAERARERKLKPEEFTGGTFSISNLGMFGVEEFSAIINPPESCILSVGALEKKPVVKGDAIVIGHRMRMTLACDHRVVDGVLGARLLREIKAVLERPIKLAL
jgi:pyruvate dehydrogenase E2 component (dihydrolipoamide acetyltransferase)